MELPEASMDALSALSDMAQSIGNIVDPDILLEKVLEAGMKTLDAERGFVLLTSDEEAAGFTRKASKNFDDTQIDDMMYLSKSVVREVLEKGEPVLLYEALKDDRYGETESIVLQQIQSIACMPISLKKKRIGALYLDSVKKRGRFTKSYLPFLQAFTNQAAIALEQARLNQMLREENRLLKSEIQRIHGFDAIIGQSTGMKRIFSTMARVLDSDVPVLIEGESGTGKELVSRALHYQGLRKDKPFLALFCGSLPESLLESELFGHKKGSFTGADADKIGLFEAAHTGTIFLDEVGDLSPRIQTMLLRVLQEGEIKRVGETHTRKVDVRVISATNRSLKDMIKAGEFREDLYYRLNTISLTMPALRHRKSDISQLAHHFLGMYAVGSRDYIKGFTPDALMALEQYHWPGNVRELENTIRRAVVMAENNRVTPVDLQLTTIESLDPFEAGITLKEGERRLVQRTLDEFEGNISETSRILGVSRSWLHYKLKEWAETEK